MLNIDLTRRAVQALMVGGPLLSSSFYDTTTTACRDQRKGWNILTFIPVLSHHQHVNKWQSRHIVESRMPISAGIHIDIHCSLDSRTREKDFHDSNTSIRAPILRGMVIIPYELFVSSKISDFTSQVSTPFRSCF